MDGLAGGGPLRARPEEVEVPDVPVEPHFELRPGEALRGKALERQGRRHRERSGRASSGASAFRRGRPRFDEVEGSGQVEGPGEIERRIASAPFPRHLADDALQFPEARVEVGGEIEPLLPRRNVDSPSQRFLGHAHTGKPCDKGAVRSEVEILDLRARRDRWLRSGIREARGDGIDAEAARRAAFLANDAARLDAGLGALHIDHGIEALDAGSRAERRVLVRHEPLPDHDVDLAREAPASGGRAAGGRAIVGRRRPSRRPRLLAFAAEAVEVEPSAGVPRQPDDRLVDLEAKDIFRREEVKQPKPDHGPRDAHEVLARLVRRRRRHAKVADLLASEPGERNRSDLDLRAQPGSRRSRDPVPHETDRKDGGQKDDEEPEREEKHGSPSEDPPPPASLLRRDGAGHVIGRHTIHHRAAENVGVKEKRL